MGDPLLVPIIAATSFLYFLGMSGVSFMFDHMDMKYSYNPNGLVKVLRSTFWFFSVMLVGLVILLSGIGRSKGDYYG